MEMKKLLGILVIGLLWCNVGFAETKDSITCKLWYGKKAEVSFKKINDKWAIEIDGTIWVDDEEKDDVGAVSTVSVTEHDAELLWTHDEMDIQFRGRERTDLREFGSASGTQFIKRRGTS